MYTTTKMIARFTHFTNSGFMLNGKNDSDNLDSIVSWGNTELAKVAIKITKPALPKIIRIVAILRLCLSLVISSDSFVVNPVPEKHDSAWNFAKDHSSPVN